MGFPFAVTVVRATVPDLVDLGARLRALDATAVGWHKLGTNDYLIEKATAWTGPQQTAATNAILATQEETPEISAQTIIDNWPIAMKALVLALIDQLNVLRSKVSPPLAAITPAQALQAVRDKAGTL